MSKVEADNLCRETFPGRMLRPAGIGKETNAQKLVKVNGDAGDKKADLHGHKLARRLEMRIPCCVILKRGSRRF